ncbi:MAG TPA: GFA family protein [Sphingorhabdus sp.]|nr:GFA family protein [Sphingorhabdus sp.]
MTYQGECFCGSVKIEVNGEPEGMGYCHCRSCRSWSGGPVNGFTLWKPENVRIIEGEADVATFAKTEISERKYCTRCGGHLMTKHPGLGVVDVFSATLPSLNFQPGLHINYQETVLPIKDGLPKFRDFPGAFGGSDEQIPE